MIPTVLTNETWLRTLKMQRSGGRSDTETSTTTNGAESTTMSAHADEQDEVKIET